MLLFRLSHISILSTIFLLIVAHPLTSKDGQHQGTSIHEIRNNELGRFVHTHNHFGKREETWDEYRVRWTGWVAVIPVEIAAQYMIQFWYKVMAGANTHWNNQVLNDRAGLDTGLISLIIQTVDGSPLDWDFVTWFARKAADLTDRGLPGSFQMTLTHITTKVAVRVTLRIRGSDVIPHKFNE